ncbi:PAS domain-containing protein [Natronomonas halophila]|uniref:sensor histidine kinase n=1 Tax=Natronomonas halophila TaxID=2747817 RepID=UPI0015B7489C|nr:histidine kinase N-terminal 7TM domain-containing protein [Natronomonas halophila]QLD84775.1 PAS domain-containing protein [Natronomonas halophila]
MAAQSTIAALYGISALSTVGLGYIVHRHGRKPGAIPLLGSIVGAGWWCTALFLASLTADYTASMWLQRSVYVGVVVVVASIFLFGLEYTGREYLITRHTLAVLSIHPLAVLVMITANPRALFFESIASDPASVTGVAIAFGPAFWVHTTYSYLLVSIAALLVVGLLYRAPALDAAQYVTVFGAIAAPTLANFAYIAGQIGFDAAPLGFVASAALFTVAITRYQFIDLVPIARDRVLDDINDAVFIVDADGHLVDVNAAGRELADELLDGAAETTLVGRELDTVLESVPEAQRLYRRLRNAETEQEVDLTIEDSHFQITATPMSGGRGRPVGWLFLVRDVTERERRERQLRERNEQLDQFASVVSHDLRNPLTVARGYTDLTRETGDLSHLDETDAAHKRMETIIDDVLALARGGDDVTDLSPTDLRETAETAWQNVDSGDCSLRVVDDATLLADRARLVRLFENFFRNAVEHGSTSPRSSTREDAVEHGATNTATKTSEPGTSTANISRDGGATLTVTVGPTPDGFYVADDGRGIPADERERIFEEGHSTSSAGTGTGLTIIQRIAKAHGWSVSCTGAESGGARFEVSGVERSED